MKILYVEDNPLDIEIARHALKPSASEFILETVSSLEEAYARLDLIQGLGIVLCDLILPDGSGLELLSHIRSRNLPLAVLIVTGGGDEEAAVAALKAGADAYLIKQVHFNDFLPQTLAAALARHRAASARRVNSLRVLYAERDTTAADRARQHLAQHAPHIRLDIVHDVHDVLSRLPRDASERSDYDAVLLDYRQPGLDALEVVGRVRDERGLDVPLVLITARGSEAVVASALQLGIDGYLTKHPGYLHELAATLESACRKVELLRERASLRESESRMRLLLESTAEAIYGVDMEGRCTFVNPACLQMLGYERPEDLVGQPIHDLIHHSHADGTPYPNQECRIYQAYRRGENIHRDDEVFWHRDGHAIPVEYWSYPMLRDGQVVGAVATFFDISERKRAEAALHQAAMVFESTRDGVVITQLDGRILAVNRAFTEITGYSEGEVLGRQPNLLHSGRQDAAFYQAMWSSIRAAGYWQGELWNRRKNGEIYPEWLTISTVRDDEGRPTHYVGVFTNLSQLKHHEAQLDHLAHHDPLTGLPNRLLLQSRLEHALDRARRHEQRIGILHIDLDHFKIVNDSLGHRTGDDLLLTVAERLRARTRQEDTFGRLGGDEFLLLLEPIETPQAPAEVAHDLLALLASPFACPGLDEVFLGASIGISIFPDDGDNVAVLLRNAETAMYQAKEQGRGRFCYYSGEMNLDARARLELEAALRRAIQRDEFELHFQPKVDMQSGSITGAEALLRWRREPSELVSPTRFIPLAEKTGLVVPIGAWVIDAACKQIRAWLDDGLREIDVAVNVSARQFHEGNLERIVADALARHRIPPQHLELELTESVLMHDPESSTALLNRLKATGIKLSLDDFGTGYSSLTYLSRFPIDAVKIDQSFVRDIVTDPSSACIVSSIIDLARRMRLKVVAEGIETEAQLGYLRRQHCDLMQGFYFSRPVQADDFAEMLRTGKSLPGTAVESHGQRTLLLVDDEANILASLRRMLRGEGYRILTADSAANGLELLASNTVQVILSDQRMPGMSGTEFFERVKALHPDTVRIVLSGYAELETIIQAVNQGAIYKFLIKPWDDDLLRGHLRDAFRYHEAIIAPRAAGSVAEPAN